ncbi:MAG: hypothetical protein ABSG84_15260 [Acidobacteriaceae bacterium]
MRILRSIGMSVAIGGLMLVLGSAAWGQTSGSGSGQGSGSGGGSTGMPGTGSGGGRLGSLTGQAGVPVTPMPGEPEGSISPQTEEEQAKLRNADRQKQLIADTQKLLSLANELKADVDKSSKDTLSLDVVRKADEIEKLAHNVKERMKCTGCS